MFQCCLFVASCSYLQLAKFDNTTYTNLTQVKPLVFDLYDQFTKDVSEAELRAMARELLLRLQQMYEYEVGKEGNIATAKQLEIVLGMFMRHVTNRWERGVWSVTHAQNNKELIGEALDIAIDTEGLKLK